MACCLTAPSHYVNQCWQIISGALWQFSGKGSKCISLMWIWKWLIWYQKRISQGPMSQVSCLRWYEVSAGREITEVILGMGSASERRRYKATASLTGWAHTRKDPWIRVTFLTFFTLCPDFHALHYSDVTWASPEPNTQELNCLFNSLFTLTHKEA